MSIVTRRVRVAAAIAGAIASFGTLTGSALAVSPQPLPVVHPFSGPHYLNPQPLPPIAR